MARISSYDQDGTLNKLDKVLGTDSITGDTKNYTINSMLQLVNQEGLVEAFDGASFAFVDYVAAADNPRGVINLNAGVASPANFSDINELYISTVDKTGLSIVEYLNNSLNNQIKVSLKGNMNQFGIYEVTAITDHDGGAYKRLTLTPRAHNGILTVQDDFFLSNYSAVFDQDFSNNSVTEFGDVHHAGSGRIITNSERTSLNNFTNNGLVHSDVVDNVTSTTTDVPLSANQGKLLKDSIDNINDLLTSDNVNLDTLQEVVDFIEANRESLNTLAISNIAGLQNALDAKQNTEAGKGLSANDFTDALLNKLNNIAANAEVNVNADWTATTGDAQILNKPTDVTDLSQHSVTELNNVTSVGSGAIITGAERTKLTNINVNNTTRTVTDGTSSIVVPPANAEQNVNADWDATTGDAQILNKPALAPSNAEPNVQADWNVTDSSSDAFILNKPALAPSNAEQNVQVDWSETDTASDAFILNKPALAPSNAEQNVQANWNETDNSSDAFIQNKPALAPANAEQNVQADWNETDTGSDSFILNKPTQVKSDWNETNVNSAAFIENKPALAPSNAEQNVQADWNESDNTSDAFIQNKPDVSVTKAKIDAALGTAAADDTYFYQGDGTWASPASNIELGDLTDVRGDTTDPGLNEGYVLRWIPSASKWYGAAYSLEHLYNVTPNQNNSVGKVLAVTSFNAQNSTNIYNAVTLNIDDLGDFDIDTPENNQIIQYNSTSSHWENVTDLQLPGTLEFTTTEATEPSFDNGIYVSTEDGHDVMHFRYHGHDLSIDYLTQVLPTGILNGGVLTKASGTEFTIAAGDGIINDLNKGANTDPHPEIIKVEWAEQTITVDGLDSANTEQLNSWIYVDNTGTVQQQSTAFTDAQKKSNIIIGSAIHSEGVVKFVKTFPHTGYNNASQMNEFAGIFGPMKKSGHKITANGANLSIDRAAGVSFALGRNYANDPENPSTVSDAAKTQCVIHRYYEDGSGSFVLDDGTSGAGYTTLDPGNYDDGSGTLATVSGGHYTVQRLYYFPGTPDIIVAYYGKDEYNSIDIAEKSYNLEDFTEAPNTSDQAIYVGAVIMAGNATDLTSSSDAKFLTAGAFRGLAAVTVGGAIAGSALNDLSDVSIQNVANDEVLRYNSSTQQWENVSDSILPITLDTANNRVGINKTVPEHVFDVDGDINIQADDSYKIGGVDVLNVSSTYTKILHPEGSNAIYLGDSADRNNYYDNNGHVFRSAGGGAEYARFNSNGLGIGTTSISENLTISGTGQVKQRIISTDNGGARFDLHSSGGGRYSFQALSNKDFLLFDEANGNTALRYYDGTSGAWSFFTNGSERLRINSSGGVGIGTTSPSANLTVRTSGAANSKAFRVEDSAGALFQVDREGDTYIKGRVGIGTASPSAYIHAQGSNEFLGYFKSTDNKGFIGIADNDTTFYISAENGRASIGSQTGVGVDNLNYDLTNKRLGIGTSSPSSKLNIVSTDADADALIVQDNARKIKIGRDSVQATNLSDAATQLYLNAAGGNVSIPASHLGVGTSSPDVKLHVKSSNAGGVVKFDFTNSTGGFNQYKSNNSTIGYIGDNYHLVSPNTNEQGNFGIRAENNMAFAIGASEKMRIDSSGNVGIGTNNPNTKLTVEGDTQTDNIVVENHAYVGGTITHWGDGDTKLQFDTDRIRLIAGNVTKFDTNDVIGTSESNNLQTDSDFADGCKVSTDIDTSVNSGDSFVMEVTGKSYTSSEPPHKFIVQGYIYNGTIINRSCVDLTGSLADGTRMYMWNDNGTLAFWWPRQGYWNSYNIRVWQATGGSSNRRGQNRATSFTNASQPATTVSKYTVTDFNAPVMKNQDGYVPDSFIVGENGNLNRISTNEGTISINNPNVASLYLQSTGTNGKEWIHMSTSDGTYKLHDRDLQQDIIRATNSYVRLQPGGTSRFEAHSAGITVNGHVTTDTNSDRYIRSYYSDGTYTELRGYGIQTNRSYAYIRPTASGTQSLFIGANPNLRWNLVEVNTDGAFAVRDTGVEVFRVEDSFVKIPSGTASSGTAGSLRFNTTESKFEGHNGTEWAEIAGSGGGGASTITRTSFSGDDTTTQFSLSENIADEANTQIYISGVYQEKTTYSVSGQQITFSEAPPEGTNNIEVIHMASVTVDGASGITRNTHTGTGSQQSFVLSVTPASEDFTFVYVDGVYADKNEYSLSNDTITFVTAPANNASVEVMTINAVNVQQTSYLANDVFTGDDSTTSFALVNGQPTNEAFTMVFVQGVYQNKNTYSLSSNNIVFTEAPADGDAVEVVSINGGGVKTLPPTQVDDVRYNVEVINTDTNAQAGYVYVFTGNLTLTLPGLPKIGQSIKISNRSNVDTCVLGAGGNKILGSTEDLTLDTASASFELIYSGSDEGWIIIGQ